jgi:hypothetical protein
MNFVKVFEKYDFLGKALNYIIKNSSSLYAPYHNLNHNITVTVFAYYIGKSEKLNKKEMEELLLAAIFHDFNHTEGKEKDDVNIKKAKEGIRKFVEKEKIKIDLDAVNKILDATQFPYIIDEKELNKQQQIIRDSDMTQMFDPTRFQHSVLGLQKEMGITYDKHLEGQEKFLKNLEFRTKLGKELKKKYWKEIMEELGYLIKINK